MKQPRVLALVLAGGKGSRMDVLTEARAKPSLPFGGVFSLLDIVLSNVSNSRIDDVWLVLQYRASSLDSVVAHGRPWDLDRSHGGLRLLHPQQGLGPHEDGMATGNSDSLFRFRKLIADFDPELVLVLSADHVYRMDFRDVVASHLDTGAECTVVTTEFYVDEVGNHTVVHTDGEGPGHRQKVTGVEQKPDKSGTNVVATEVFCFDADVLLDTLTALFEALPEGEHLSDFGVDLLPAVIERGRTFAYHHDQYWRDLGRPGAYLAAHHELLDDAVDVFTQPGWPIRTATDQRPAAIIGEKAQVNDSMVAPGASVHGRVERSVLGPGVVIEEGAHVVDSVVMADVVVRADATVGWSIVDDEAVIGAGATVGSLVNPSGGVRAQSEDIALVGAGARVDGGAVVAPGDSISPGARRRKN